MPQKRITKEEMGQGLWEICCQLSNDFCTNLRPEFQAKSFLQNSAADNLFLLESVKLHLWIISFALNNDRAVLDVLHNIFVSWAPSWSPKAAENLSARFALYNKAFLKDEELHTKGAVAVELTHAALQCLLNDGKPSEQIGFVGLGSLLITEVQGMISVTFPSVREFRSEFIIVGT